MNPRLEKGARICHITPTGTVLVLRRTQMPQEDDRLFSRPPGRFLLSYRVEFLQFCVFFQWRGLFVGQSFQVVMLNTFFRPYFLTMERQL
jgi:hypothetical protein